MLDRLGYIITREVEREGGTAVVVGMPRSVRVLGQRFGVFRQLFGKSSPPPRSQLALLVVHATQGPARSVAHQAGWNLS
jgi:hypothetical protein